MLNPVKRFPTIIGDTTRQHIVIFEFSVGPDGDVDFDYPDIAIALKVEEFIRFVYTAIPEEFTFKQSMALMKAWKVNEQQVAQLFIQRLNKKADTVTQARLHVIYQNMSIRFSTQFVQPDRDYVADLDITGLRTQALSITPNQDNGNNEHRFVYRLELTKDYTALQSNQNFYYAESFDGLDYFLKHVKKIYDSLARMLLQDYYHKQFKNNLMISDIVPEIPDQFELNMDEILNSYDKAVKTLIEHSSPEHQIEGRTRGQQVLSLDIRIRIADVPNGKPRLIALGELSSITDYQLEEGGTDKEYTVWWRQNKTPSTPKLESSQLPELKSPT